MTLQADFVDKVMSLSVEDRAELAKQLLLSLEPPNANTPEEVEAAWAAEIKRRLEQVDRGEVTPIDAREAIAGARRSLEQRRRK